MDLSQDQKKNQFENLSLLQSGFFEVVILLQIYTDMFITSHKIMFVDFLKMKFRLKRFEEIKRWICLSQISLLGKNEIRYDYFPNNL